MKKRTPKYTPGSNAEFKATLRAAAMGPIKTTGTFRGKSNKLGYGGRSAQLKARGVPGGVIGILARASQTAPGQKNYHGKRGKK